MITFEDTKNWLGSDADLTEVIGLLTDVANGLYEPKQLLKDITEYKEHDA